MLKTILGFTPVLAGVFSTCVLVGCSEGGKPICDEGEECDTSGNLDEKDGGKVVKPGKDGGVIKDASKPAAKPDATVLAKTFLPCDVKAVVDEKCGTCHGSAPQFGAPMALASAADFQVTDDQKRVMYANVKDKINATDPREAMPPASSDALTDDEKKMLSAWLDKGAPGESKACTMTGNVDPVDPGPDDPGPYVPPTDDELDCKRMVAHTGDGKTPFKVGVARDVYYALTFAQPWDATAYGIVVRSVIDNKKALHHWLLFQDNLPGIPGGPVQQIGAHPTGQLLAAWAPGADDMDFRKLGEEIGLELPKETTYTLELHYNSSDAAAVDASGVEICVAKRKPKNVAAYSWVGFDNTSFPSAQWTGTCRPLSQEPIHIVSLMPHMHLKGIHMKGTINRANGTKEVIHDEPFDFNYQRSYPVDVWMMPGDTLTTVCDYSEPKVFGQPTDQEMCYLFSMAYPKGALAAPDIWGTVAHGSSSCLGQ
jgi:mono/diheme cytochrome c family protein